MEAMATAPLGQQQQQHLPQWRQRQSLLKLCINFKMAETHQPGKSMRVPVSVCMCMCVGALPACVCVRSSRYLVAVENLLVKEKGKERRQAGVRTAEKSRNKRRGGRRRGRSRHSSNDE